MCIEIDLVFLWGSKLNWFYEWAENDLILVRVSIHLIFVWVVETDLVFCVRAENDLVLGWASKLTWFLGRLSKLT